ncbi:MAG: methyltransferase domain-containing protein [Moraxella sp.]|nr:methyltransferase domain-containing protein [Moraxella sp.]
MLTCPICRTPLTLFEKSYRCTHRHSFDVAKEGYVNLHVVQHKKSKNPGDAPESVAARRRFLEKGYYAPLKSALSTLVAEYFPDKTAHILDIGCGEGYYTEALADHAKTVVALDIAKSAVQIASKKDKVRQNSPITWVVGTGAVLPMADGSVDSCTSLFSPLPKSEMVRVLKKGGLLIVATPAPDHLYSLRAALFGKVIRHDPEKFIATLSPEFKLIKEQHITASFELGREDLADLVTMTPYAYKAKSDRKTALMQSDNFHSVAEFFIYVFKKTDT